MDISITYIFFWNYGGYFEEYVKKMSKYLCLIISLR